MRLSVAALGLSALLGISAVPLAALADIPGPRDVCEVEGTGCETCWQHFSGDQRNTETFAKCSEGLAAKGLKEVCRHQQGAGETVYFCPDGTKAAKVTRNVGGGGGCAGCSVGSEGGWGALAALATGIGLVAWRRRRAEKK